MGRITPENKPPLEEEQSANRILACLWPSILKGGWGGEKRERERDAGEQDGGTRLWALPSAQQAPMLPSSQHRHSTVTNLRCLRSLFTSVLSHAPGR